MPPAKKELGNGSFSNGNPSREITKDIVGSSFSGRVPHPSVDMGPILSGLEKDGEKRFTMALLAKQLHVRISFSVHSNPLSMDYAPS